MLNPRDSKEATTDQGVSILWRESLSPKRLAPSRLGGQGQQKDGGSSVACVH